MPRIHVVIVLLLVLVAVCGVVADYPTRTTATTTMTTTGVTPPYCPEGSFISPAGECLGCFDFRDSVADCGETCCGKFGCGTYVANAQGYTACFKRSLDGAAANVAVPICLGMAFFMLVAYVFYDRSSAVTCFLLAHMVTTIGLIVAVVAACTYPIYLRAVDYSAVTASQDVVLACVPTLLIHVCCAILGACLTKQPRNMYAVYLVGNAAPLVGLVVFCATLRSAGGSQVPLQNPDHSAHQMLPLDPRYATNGLYYFMIVTFVVLCLVCAVRIWRAVPARHTTTSYNAQSYELGRV